MRKTPLPNDECVIVNKYPEYFPLILPLSSRILKCDIFFESFIAGKFGYLGIRANFILTEKLYLFQEK